MAVSLIVAQTNSVVNSFYRVEMSVVTSSGIASEVFVKRESTQEYDRVATVYDMYSVPVIPTPNDGYYRDTWIKIDTLDVNLTKDFANTIISRVDSLVKNYEAYQEDFVGSTEITFPII